MRQEEKERKGTYSFESQVTEREGETKRFSVCWSTPLIAYQLPWGLSRGLRGPGTWVTHDCRTVLGAGQQAFLITNQASGWPHGAEGSAPASLNNLHAFYFMCFS